MRKLAAISMALILCASLTACKVRVTTKPGAEDSESHVSSESQSVSEPAVEEDSQQPVGIDSARVGTLEDPIPLGEWGVIPFFNSYDSATVSMYARIIGVFPQGSESHMYETLMQEASENDDSFDLYEYESAWEESFATSDDTEGVIVQYQLYLPEMTCLERGLADPSVSFSPVTTEPIVGGVTGNTYSYSGGSAFRLATSEMNFSQTYLPNHTYTGSCLYEMVTGSTDYVLCVEYNDLFSEDGETQYCYFSANKE